MRWLLPVVVAGCRLQETHYSSGGNVVDASVDADALGVPTYVYAHTANDLYRIDPDSLSVTHVDSFQWPGAPDQMTDIAIDRHGAMIGVSFSSVYSVDPATARVTQLASALSGTFNGLSFVDASAVGMTGDDVLVGTRNQDGVVFQIDPMTGAATEIGNMGGTFVSSGDIVAIDGFGMVQTTIGTSDDQLVRLSPTSFAATAIGSVTGYSSIWGVAFAKGRILGFTLGGDFITIDPATAQPTLVAGGGPMWWGAAVSTAAPLHPN